MEKKNLAKMAIAALMLASAAPAASDATESETSGLFLAGGCKSSSKGCGATCGAASYGCKASFGCKATCGAMPGSPTGATGTTNHYHYNSDGSYEVPVDQHYTPQSHYGQPSSYSTPTQVPSTPTYPAGNSSWTRSNNNGYSSNWNKATTTQNPEPVTEYSSGTSSYQGTTQGPGPNGGYPGTPKGSYNTHYYNSSGNYNRQ